MKKLKAAKVREDEVRKVEAKDEVREAEAKSC